jgi:hypothetical protein
MGHCKSPGRTMTMTWPQRTTSFLKPVMVTDILCLAWEHRLLARGWYELSRACCLTIRELIVQWQSVACEIRACLFAPSHDAVRALAPYLLKVPSIAYDCMCNLTSGMSVRVVRVFLQHAAQSGTLAATALKELDFALQSLPASVHAWEAHNLSNRDLVEALMLNGPGQAERNGRALHTLATSMLAITASCRIKLSSQLKAKSACSSSESKSGDCLSTCMFEMAL